jgi:anti-anti-sigma factor
MDVGRPDPVGPVFEAVGHAHGVTWAWAGRDLDMASAAAARGELADLVSAADGRGSVLVHLGTGCFVDLHGLRVLVDAAALMGDRDGGLLVVSPPRCLRVMVAITGLGTTLFFAPTAAHAARWARGRTPAHHGPGRACGVRACTAGRGGRR